MRKQLVKMSFVAFGVLAILLSTMPVAHAAPNAIRKSTISPVVHAALNSPQIICLAGYYITNARNTGGYDEYYYSSVTGYNGTNGNATLSKNFGFTATNSYNATVGVSAGTVSAGVGFSVTQSTSDSSSWSITVPPGQTGEIDLYIDYWFWTYDVWVASGPPPCPAAHQVGTGWADQYWRPRFYGYTY